MKKGWILLDKILTIEDLLSQLREPKNKHLNPFEELLPEARKLLGLDSELDAISLEALLIQAIIYCVFDSENEPDEISKEDAKKRDSYLLTMGLMDGYYHVKDDDIHYSAPLRQKEYLAYSEYIEISYEQEIRHNLSTVEERYVKAKAVLSTTDGRCRENLADYLSKNKNCKECFEKGSEKFIEKIKLPNKETKRQLVIPKPCYTRENFPLPVEQDEDSSPVQSPAEDGPSDDAVIAELSESGEQKDQETDKSCDGNTIASISTSPDSNISIPSKNAVLGKETEEFDDSDKQKDEQCAEESVELTHSQESEAFIAESRSIAPLSIVDGDISNNDVYDNEEDNGDDEVDNDDGDSDDEINSEKTEPDRHSKKRLAIIVLVICLCIGGIATVPFFPSKQPASTEDSEPDLRVLGDPSHAVNGDDMEKLANEAFSSIAVYNDSGEYDAYEMKDLVINRIFENPIFGDMVAQGMLVAFSQGDSDYFADFIPGFQKFVDATDLAMNEQEDIEKRCMKKWLTKSHVVYTTDEYKEYVGDICELLDYAFSPEIQNFKVTDYWDLDPDSGIMDVRAIRCSEKRTSPVLLFSRSTGNGKCKCIFGFLIENGSFVISDPYNWGTDSFTE